MPRVIGIDPGTVSIDLCGLEDGTVFLDRSFPTAAALADPGAFVALLTDAGPLDLIAGPSGYGLPLVRAREATEEDLPLAFTAAIAVAGGKIVDGAGGSAGPLGFRAAGALDGEVAYLAGVVSKAMLFTGGAASVAGWDTAAVVAPERFARPAAPRERVAWDAFIESAVKFATAIALSVPSPREFVLSGRLAQVEAVQQAIRQRLGVVAPTHSLDGFAHVAKQGAHGAALVADGLAGGRHRALVEAMAIRAARGTALDHLYVVPREAARRRLGLG